MSTTPMTKLPSEHDEVIEEALGEIVEAAESGTVRREAVEALLNQRVNRKVLPELVERRLVEMKGDNVSLTPDGESIAKALLRRSRLAERLMKDVLNVPDQFIEPAACQWEHILSKEVADSICTLLGHPRQSPRHQPIPAGECCRSAATKIAPVVCPLSKIGPGEKARISYLMVKQHPELDRLLSMGLVPGTTVEVIQRFPTFVVQVNESQLAFDEAIAEGVFVHPRP
jgi:DtxR family transcriptional regulator, Mn-dependent transcriptional regulator